MREKIQLSALVAMVNQEMQKYPECEDVSLTSWSPAERRCSQRNRPRLNAQPGSIEF